MKRTIAILLKSIADKSGFTAVTDGVAKYKKGLGDLSKAGRVVAHADYLASLKAIADRLKAEKGGADD